MGQCNLDRVVFGLDFHHDFDGVGLAMTIRDFNRQYGGVIEIGLIDHFHVDLPGTI